MAAAKSRQDRSLLSYLIEYVILCDIINMILFTLVATCCNCCNYVIVSIPVCDLWDSSERFVSDLSCHRARKSSRRWSSSELTWMRGPTMAWTVRCLAKRQSNFCHQSNNADFISNIYLMKSGDSSTVLTMLIGAMAPRFLARNPEQVRVLIYAKADLHSHCEPLGAEIRN